METGHSHPFDGHLLVKENGVIVKRPILSPSQYVSAGSVDKTAMTIDTMSSMPEFRTLFPFMRTYTIEMVLAGQSGTMQIEAQKPFLLWGARLQPTFFDGQLVTPEHLSCYQESKRRAVPGMMHSGDKRSNTHFMHSMCCTSFVPNVFVASAVGYSYTELVRFEAVSPFILLVDHVRETMMAVPFSLERATIGSSMLIAPLVFQMNDRGVVRWYVPPSCPTDGRVNTGEYSPAFRHKMRELAASFDRDFASYQRRPIDVTPPPPLSVSACAQTRSGFKRLVFVQTGVRTIIEDASFNPDRGVVHFGHTLSLASDFVATSASNMVLPILSGVAHGHVALALGSCASVGVYGAFANSDEWRKTVDACSSVVVHINDGTEWYENVLQSMLHRVVGLMIVHLSKNLSKDAAARISELSSMKLCGVRLMSGVSIVLVHTPDGEAFFYRGAIGVLPISPENPSFADPIDLGMTLAMHASRDAPLVFGSFVDKDSKTMLLHDGRVIETDALSTVVDLLMSDSGVSWSNLVAQLSVCLSAAEVDAYKERLTTTILALEAEETHSAKEHLNALIKDLKSAFAAAPVGVDITLHTQHARQLVFDQKRLIKEAQKTYREALGRVQQICSFKVVSARNVGVQQAQRKLAVATNVARASNLSAAQLAEKLIDSTTGFAVARIDVDKATIFLQNISAGKMDEFMQQLADPMRVMTNPAADARLDIGACFDRMNPGFLLAPNCTMLDSESVEILLEHVQRTDHILTSTKKQLTFCMQAIPHLVLPLYEDASKLDGSYVDFMNEANDEAKADYRVTLRGVLASLKARIPIRPNSPDLTYGIMLIVLSLMLSMTRDVDLQTLEPTSTVCQTLRGLMYLWGTFAGSGQKPVTFAYQLTQPGAKIVQPKLQGCDAAPHHRIPISPSS